MQQKAAGTTQCNSRNFWEHSHVLRRPCIFLQLCREQLPIVVYPHPKMSLNNFCVTAVVQRAVASLNHLSKHQNYVQLVYIFDKHEHESS